jgi:transcriptional regulator GlxA family with amidase domain
MTKSRRIVFLAYDGFELLDLSGPSAVFSTANILSRSPLYETLVASPRGGRVASSCGVCVDTRPCAGLRFRAGDTVLAMGAYAGPLGEAMASRTLLSALKRASKAADRYGSVCAGTFLLGEAGLLSGRRAVTHWRGCAILAERYPDATVEADALYVVDDRLWTSAGVATAIDMALCMLERDHGARLMGMVARQLVVYAHRPGNQSQFSALLEAQSAADSVFSDVVAWLARNPDKPLRVADMAAKARMSERTFHRRFTEATGLGPAKYFERMRLETAKRYLEAGQPAKTVAARVGYASESAFRSAFAARFGVTPAHHQRMQRGRAPDAPTR